MRRSVLSGVATWLAFSLACGGTSPPVDEAPAAPAPAVPAPPGVKHTPRPAPWGDWEPVDPYAALPRRCASFDPDGTLSSYEDAPMFVHRAEGTWTRDGDVIRMAWTTKNSSRVDAPEGTDTATEGRKVWVESESPASAAMVLHGAWEREVIDEEDEVPTVIFATALEPACTECATLIRCENYASHEGGYNGDTWFGPSVPADVWAQVIDGGGGEAAVAEAGATVERYAEFVLPGPPAKAPRDGVEVLHRDGERARAAAERMAAALGGLSARVKVTPWAEAPHPVVVVVGPTDRWTPDLVAVEVYPGDGGTIACPTAASSGAPGPFWFRPDDLPATCTATHGDERVEATVRRRGDLRCSAGRKGLTCREPD